MHIVFVLSNQKGSFCGVVDYCSQLVTALQALGDTVSMEKLDCWSFETLWRFFLAHRKDKATIIHLQYPSMGMRRSPAPAFLPLLLGCNRVFLTLHEFSVLNFVRRLYLIFFKMENIVFTNEAERIAFARFFFWKKGTASVIPIGNNIDVVPIEDAERTESLVYFGQIIERKGIEEFLDAVRILRERGSKIPCAIIGAMVDAQSVIAQAIADAAAKYGIDCLYDKSPEEISRALQRATIALLPFPIGVNDKRGSAIACLRHGLTVITCHTGITTGWWRQTTYDAPGPGQAAQLVQDIIAGIKPRHPAPDMLIKALRAREWPQIAQKYKNLYLARR